MPSDSSEPKASYDVVPVLSAELGLPHTSIRAVVRLLGDGATVPFIARYRKEQTGGLDEVQIRSIEERFTYLTELEARRESVIAEIKSQGKLTPELAQKLACVRSNVTQLVDRLESGGLVKREADPADRRSIRAVITDAGRDRERAGSMALSEVQDKISHILGRYDVGHIEQALSALRT